MTDKEVLPDPPVVVFIHRVDTYFGRILAQHLGTSQPLATSSDTAEINPTFKSAAFLDALGSPENFQIIGSYRLPKLSDDPQIPRPEEPRPAPSIPAARRLFSVASEADLAKAINDAKIHIYHTLDDDGKNELFSDTEKTLAAAKIQVTNAKSKKMIILISSLMTWSKTRITAVKEKPKENKDEAEEEEKDPLTEADFKRRKPHPNFKPYLDMEKDLLKFAKDSHRRIHATIIAAGILYGYGERILHWFVKDAWHNAPTLPLLGDGKNQVPMMHTRDLAQVVQNVCDNRPKVRYIVAVDAGGHTLQDVVEAVGHQFTTGSVVSVPLDGAVTDGKLSQADCDTLMSDLHFEGRTILESMKLQWIAEEGFIKSLPRTIREYKRVRNLLPIRVAVLGPPFSGKTTMAKKLADYYKLHYISAEQIVQDTEKELRARFGAIPIVKVPVMVAEVPEGSEEDGDGADSPVESVDIPGEKGSTETPGGVPGARKLLAEIEASRGENGEQLGNALVVRLVRERLLSKPCLNQGYVLDGAPTSYGMARQLFAPVEVDKEEEGEELEEEEPVVEGDEADDEEIPPFDKKIIPDYIFYLDVPFDTILKKKMEQPDSSLMESTEKQFKKRLAEYTAQNPDEQSTLTFFDEIENHAQWIDVSKNDDSARLSSFLTMLNKIGKPHNYGLTDAEKKANAVQDEAVRLRRALDQAETKKKQETANRSDQIAQEATWKKQLEFLQTEDYARRELLAMPVEQYLFRHVFPTIHEGLLQCGRLMPADPVDFLAEYLLQKTRPSNWSELSRLFDRKKPVPPPPVREESGDAQAEDGGKASSTARQAALLEEEQHHLITETTQMFADFTDRLSMVDLKFVTEAAYMTPDLSESILNVVGGAGEEQPAAVMDTAAAPPGNTAAPQLSAASEPAEET